MPLEFTPPGLQPLHATVATGETRRYIGERVRGRSLGQENAPDMTQIVWLEKLMTISPAVRIYVAIGTTDLRRSIDAFSLKSKVRTIKKARSGMAIA